MSILFNYHLHMICLLFAQWAQTVVEAEKNCMYPSYIWICFTYGTLHVRVRMVLPKMQDLIAALQIMSST